jgi:TonB-linked SusC/RagA family outer membrane protein
MLTGTAVYSQKTITGKITNATTKEPLAGASVLVKGTSSGTQTDMDGKFTLVLPATGSTISVSAVGFKTREMAVGENATFDIELTEGIDPLDEVVVTGYTSQRKKDITGAVSVVNVGDLKAVPAANATSQLQGRASGVTVVENGVPGSESQVRIRGMGSFSNNNPLYVVDGVQTSSIASLNPNDIESMQVLKDAASSSIYGVRASNGVIVITTKKGKGKGVNVAYDMYYGIQNPGNGFDLLNAQEEGELLFLARKNSGLATTGSIYGNGASPVLPPYIFYSGAPNNGVPITSNNPGVDPSKYSLDYGRLGDPGYSPYIIVPSSAGTNWYNEITRNAPIQNHNVTVSGQGDASRYMLSLNYFDQDAITKMQFFKRYTARLNSEFKVLKGVRIGENLQLEYNEGNTGNNANIESSIIANSFRPMSIIPVYTINGKDFAGSAGGTGFGTLGNSKNPLAQLSRAENNRGRGTSIFGNVYGEVDFLDGFTFRTSFGGGLNNSYYFTYPFIEYEHTENNANQTYSEGSFNSYTWIWTNTLAYKKTFGNHNVAALAGYESQKSSGRQIIGNSTGYYAYNYQPFINLNNGTVQNLGGSVAYTPVTNLSYFGKVDYSFRGKYLVSASLRRDGSSKFLDPNKYGTFPAFSLGWRIVDEPFMSGSGFFNDLKLRGGWGKSGNEAALSPSNSFTTFGSNRQSSWYDIAGTQASPMEGFFLSFVGNPNGGWEKSVSTNIGFDATILKNSTDIVFDWYQRKTEGLLYNPAGQGIAGAVAANNPPFRNVGSMQNTGVDLMITNRAKIAKDLRLISTLTFTTYKNEITAITNDGLKFFDFNSPANEQNRIGAPITRNIVGNPMNTFFGYQVAGIFQSAAEVASAPTQSGAAPGRFRYADINGDKKIDADDRTILGDPNANFTYGLNLALEYKNFDFVAFFYGVQGRDIFNYTKWWTDFSGGFPGGRSKRSLYESWLPDGSRPGAKTPIQETSNGFSSGSTVNSYYVEDGSYLRLRNLQIGYTFKIKGISSFRAYIQGTNLFTATKYSGIDPEILVNSNSAQGIDTGAFPIVSQYTFGLNVKF